jgi:hypothetical protein
MRDLHIVIDQMLAEIPQDQKILREDLEQAKSSVLFAAPEMMRHWWSRVAHILARNIQNPQLAWHHKVVKIWKDET